jgi:hypothetical protein
MFVYSIRNYRWGLGLLAVAVAAAATGCQKEDPRAATDQPPLAADGSSLSGTVTQALAAGSYTYFQLRRPDARLLWVVVRDRAHRTALHLTVDGCHGGRDFKSRRLGRSFPTLYFCSIRTGNQQDQRRS